MSDHKDTEVPSEDHSPSDEGPLEDPDDTVDLTVEEMTALLKGASGEAVSKQMVNSDDTPMGKFAWLMAMNEENSAGAKGLKSLQRITRFLMLIRSKRDEGMSRETLRKCFQDMSDVAFDILIQSMNASAYIQISANQIHITERGESKIPAFDTYLSSVGQ